MNDDYPTYPSGLRLAGRRVVVVGGGHVAQRRVPGLIAVGARVRVVAPEVTPAIEGLAGAGEIDWARRRFEEADLDGAWYAVAATDDHDGSSGEPEAGGVRREVVHRPIFRRPGPRSWPRFTHRTRLGTIRHLS